MDNQFIIVIGHKSGCSGNQTAELLAKKLGVRLYSKALADEMLPAGKISYCVDENGFITASPKNNVEAKKKLKRGEVIATFSYIRERALRGECFVVLESCADYYLSDLPCVTRVFLTADDAWRISSVSTSEGISERDAEKLIRHTDRSRRAFHDYYCKTRWGSEKSYDCVIDCTGKSADEISDKIKALINDL